MAIICVIKSLYQNEFIVFGHVVSEDLGRDVLIPGVKIVNSNIFKVSMFNAEKRIFLNMIIDGVLNHVSGDKEYFLR